MVCSLYAAAACWAFWSLQPLLVLLVYRAGPAAVKISNLHRDREAAAVSLEREVMKYTKNTVETEAELIVE